MKMKELQEKLEELNLPKYMYSLKGGLPNEACCIGENNGIWEVYYSERGHKSLLKTFEKEEDACQYFYKFVKEAR